MKNLEYDIAYVDSGLNVTSNPTVGDALAVLSMSSGIAKEIGRQSMPDPMFGNVAGQVLDDIINAILDYTKNCSEHVDDPFATLFEPLKDIYSEMLEPPTGPQLS